jgi:fatty acid desaturase
MSVSARSEPSGVDRPTLGLFVVIAAGMGVNVAAAAAALLPLPLAAVVATLLLNCSFTVWHEAVHGNLARRPRLNDAIGLAAAWLSMTPYFRIRQVHREHHAFTNDPVRDPDSLYVAGSFFTLPLRYARILRRYRQIHLPLGERLLDGMGFLLVIAITALAWLAGHGATIVATWLLPKAASLALHAWYVNYLPHHGRPQGRFTSARVIERMGWLQPFVLFHNYHGLHHAYQRVPWHRYRQEFERRRPELVAHHMPVQPSLRSGR